MESVTEIPTTPRKNLEELKNRLAKATEVDTSKLDLIIDPDTGKLKSPEEVKEVLKQAGLSPEPPQEHPSPEQSPLNLYETIANRIRANYQAALGNATVEQAKKIYNQIEEEISGVIGEIEKRMRFDEQGNIANLDEITAIANGTDTET